MRAYMRRAALAAMAWAGAQGAFAEEALTRLFSYEALPSAQLTLNLEAADYVQRAAATQAVLDALAPQVFAAAGVDPAAVETDLTPGGYLLQTNASLQARAAVTQAQATRLAAALGYVFRQWSVLVSRIDAPEGETAYVTVAFPEGALDATLAHGFFLHAAAVAEGLGGGYTAFGDTMIFLNVRGADGAPYSGLEDMAFAARLGQAAGSFPNAPVMIAGAGYAEARFVENDWATQAAGEAYAALIGDAATLATLDALRAEHDTLIGGFADRFGWR